MAYGLKASSCDPLTCMPNTWFQSVTVDRFLMSYSTHIQINFWRIIQTNSIVGLATNTCSHACVKGSVYQWPSTDYRRPTLRMFSTSVRFLSFLSFFLSFCLSFFLSFVFFFNIQSWDTWLATFFQSVNRWPFSDLRRPVLHMCNATTSFSLSETQIHKCVLWPMHMIAL